MTIKKVIQTLQQRGVKVTAFKRKDGGYLIKSLDGQSFKKSEGNKAARAMLGVTLSPEKTQQLKDATKQRIAISKGKASRVTPLDKAIKNQIARINRKLKKLSIKEGKKRGRIHVSTVRANIRKYGQDWVKKQLDSVERYHQGYAYAKNVKLLMGRLDLVGQKIITLTKSSMLPEYKEMLIKVKEEIYSTLNKMINAGDKFQESWINDIYQHLYEVENAARFGNYSAVIDELKMIKKIIKL